MELSALRHSLRRLLSHADDRLAVSLPQHIRLILEHRLRVSLPLQVAVENLRSLALRLDLEATVGLEKSVFTVEVSLPTRRVGAEKLA